MNKLISTLVLVMVAVGGFAQEYKSRQPRPPEREKLSGATEYIQDVFWRNNRPIFVNTNESPVYTISSQTNIYQGLFIFYPTNAGLAATFTVALPNPTNSLYRTFRFLTPDGCHIVLSNNWGGFADIKTFGVSNLVWLVTSNKLATCYSTGTNYWVRVE